MPELGFSVLFGRKVCKFLHCNLRICFSRIAKQFDILGHTHASHLSLSWCIRERMALD